ncbi:hypothetical protein GCM10027565_32390 [Bordetella tumulicola]
MFHLFANGALGHAEFLGRAGKTVMSGSDLESLKVSQRGTKSAHDKREIEMAICNYLRLHA